MPDAPRSAEAAGEPPAVLDVLESLLPLLSHDPGCRLGVRDGTTTYGCSCSVGHRVRFIKRALASSPPAGTRETGEEMRALRDVLNRIANGYGCTSPGCVESGDGSGNNCVCLSSSDRWLVGALIRAARSVAALSGSAPRESEGVPLGTPPKAPEVLAGMTPLGWRPGAWHPRTHDPLAIAEDHAILEAREKCRARKHKVLHDPPCLDCRREALTAARGADATGDK